MSSGKKTPAVRQKEKAAVQNSAPQKQARLMATASLQAGSHNNTKNGGASKESLLSKKLIKKASLKQRFVDATIQLLKTNNKEILQILLQRATLPSDWDREQLTPLIQVIQTKALGSKWHDDFLNDVLHEINVRQRELLRDTRDSVTRFVEKMKPDFSAEAAAKLSIVQMFNRLYGSGRGRTQPRFFNPEWQMIALEKMKKKANSISPPYDDVALVTNLLRWDTQKKTFYFRDSSTAEGKIQLSGDEIDEDNEEESGHPFAAELALLSLEQVQAVGALVGFPKRNKDATIKFLVADALENSESFEVIKDYLAKLAPESDLSDDKQQELRAILEELDRMSLMTYVQLGCGIQSQGTKSDLISLIVEHAKKTPAFCSGTLSWASNLKGMAAAQEEDWRAARQEPAKKPEVAKKSEESNGAGKAELQSAKGPPSNDLVISTKQMRPWKNC